MTSLSTTEKDAQVGKLWVRVAALTATVADLQGRLAKKKRELQQVTWSSDGLNKPKWKCLRLVGNKLMGGQEGHTVHNLKRVAQSDLMETHAAAAMRGHRALGLKAECSCGKVHPGVFPAAVPVQYGARRKDSVV